MKKIFISHSSIDKQIVEQLIDLFEIIGVDNKSIFCSSFEGYGAMLGENFLDRIKNEINEEVLMIFLLSKNYYNSTISICEMGAAWVKTKHHIPLLIPPFDYNDVKGVIPLTQGMKVNEIEKYNTLKKKIEQLFEIESIEFTIWERKRNNIVAKINEIIKESSKPTSTTQHTEAKKTRTSDNYYDERDGEIKERAKIEWPNDFNMQVHYIKQQKDAIETLRTSIPNDIDEGIFTKIREQGRQKWPNSFTMQVHYEKQQIESIQNLNRM
jgi:hypothetical protein